MIQEKGRETLASQPLQNDPRHAHRPPYNRSEGAVRRSPRQTEVEQDERKEDLKEPMGQGERNQKELSMPASNYEIGPESWSRAKGTGGGFAHLPISRIMAPIDGSRNSVAALQVAVSLAKDYEAELIVVHVLHARSLLFSTPLISGVPSASSRQTYEAEEKEAKKMVDDAVGFAARHGVKASGQVAGPADTIAKEIVESAASRGVDLIVIGTRGLGAFKRLFMGSVSAGVASRATCPVLVVK